MSPPNKSQEPESERPDQDEQRDHLPPPIVPAILKDEMGNESPDGLLPRDVLNRALQVTIPEWTSPPGPDVPRHFVLVGWRPVGRPFVEVARFPFDTPIDPGDKIVTVPQGELSHGVYDLSYKISIGGNEHESQIKRITVDREPPNDGQEPVALEMLGVVGDITEDYLNAHGEVRFKAPAYVGLKDRDRAIFYWTDNPNPPNFETEIREQAFSQLDIDIDLLIITMYERDIRDRGPGQRYIYYRLRDWSGNRGPISALLPVFVDLLPAPAPLKPPRVPLSSRGLIDREHAREGAVNEGAVTVEIDAYDDPDSSHKVLIDWNGIPLAELDVDPAGFPLVTTVPWSTLRAFGLGPLSARVVYRVRRGSVSSPPSLETRVPVDLTIAGPDHGFAPELLNTTLARLEVYGAHSGILNTLMTEDFGEPADAFLSLYDMPQPGQAIEIYWGAISAPVASYVVQLGDVAGKRVPFSIPWSVINQDRENPALPVYYTTSNGVNLQRALITPVKVSIVVIDNLKEPSFPHADKFRVLDCCACPRLWKGVWVKIDGNADFDAGDEVTLHWQGCEKENGSSPIPGVFDTFPVTLTDDQARNGFEIHVDDYERLIAPMVNNGSALCHYDLKKSGGGIGTSNEQFVVINRTMASGAVCSPMNETCAVPCDK